MCDIDAQKTSVYKKQGRQQRREKCVRVRTSLLFVCISFCFECVRAAACVRVDASCVWRCYNFHNKVINPPIKQNLQGIAQ